MNMKDEQIAASEQAPLEMLDGLRVESMFDYDLDAGVALFDQNLANVPPPAVGGTFAKWGGLGVGALAMAGLVAALLTSGGDSEVALDAPAAEPPLSQVRTAPPAHAEAPAPTQALSAPPLAEGRAVADTPVETPAVQSPNRTAPRSAKPRPSNDPSEQAAPLPSEIELAAKMRRVLEREPAEALRLAAQGERLYPDGMFGRERQAYRILALIALGRTDEANKKAQRYLERHPSGAHSERIRKALGER